MKKLQALLVLALGVSACGGSPVAGSNPHGDAPCPAAPPNASFDVHFVEAYTAKPLPGLAIALCERTDLACQTPLASGALDADGRATFATPEAEFYIQATGEGMVTNLIYAPTAPLLEAAIYTPAAVALTQSLVELTFDPNRAIVHVLARGCGGAAEGETISVSTADAETSTAYFEGGGAVLSRGARATDSTGEAFSFDVPAGVFDVASRTTGGVANAANAAARSGAVVSVVVGPT